MSAAQARSPGPSWGRSDTPCEHTFADKVGVRSLRPSTACPRLPSCHARPEALVLRACTDTQHLCCGPHLRTLSPPSCPHNTSLLPAPGAHSALRVEARRCSPSTWSLTWSRGWRKPALGPMRWPARTWTHPAPWGMHWPPAAFPVVALGARSGSDKLSARWPGGAVSGQPGHLGRLRAPAGCLPAALRTAARCLPRCFWLQSPHTQACIPPTPPSLPLCLKSHLLPGLGSSGGWALSA